MREIAPRTLRQARWITIGGSVIMLLGVGIFFVNLIAAFVILGLMLV